VGGGRAGGGAEGWRGGLGGREEIYFLWGGGGGTADSGWSNKNGNLLEGKKHRRKTGRPSQRRGAESESTTRCIENKLRPSEWGKGNGGRGT